MNYNMSDASDNITEINRLIASIVQSVEQLKEVSGKMQEDGKNSMLIMNELMESNQRTNHAVERINDQINLTYHASEKISKASEMITGVANQTRLLALNASIEAARAGEAGKGFAVVAGEISALSDQSDQSAKEITELIQTLSDESGRMLEIMKEVVEEETNQKQNMERTKEHFGKVNKGIEASLKDIVRIGELAGVCDKEKDKVTVHIEELKKLSEDSMKSTKDTKEKVDVMRKSISDTEELSEKLKEYAGTLDDHVRQFVIE